MGPDWSKLTSARRVYAYCSRSSLHTGHIEKNVNGLVLRRSLHFEGASEGFAVAAMMPLLVCLHEIKPEISLGARASRGCLPVPSNIVG